MEQIQKILTETVRELFGEILVNEVKIQVEESTNQKCGDLNTNVAMLLAGKIHQTPQSIAVKIVASLMKNPLFEEAEVAGPGFINLTIDPHYFAPLVLDGSLNEKLLQKSNIGKVAVVEFPSPNLAKPYSVGHLRSGNQGWAVKKLLEKTGWKVITDNHLGDGGTPFGIWVLGYQKYSSPEKLAEGGVYELGRVYILIKKDLEEEKKVGKSTLAQQAQEWLIKLENKDAVAMEYAKKFQKISLDHIHQIMARLKITTDYELGESFYLQSGKEAVKKMLTKKLAEKESDGSIIVKLDEYGIKTPLLIQKSNGAGLYATTDLGTLLFREKEFHPDLVVYAVGAEQKFYFTQIAALAKKLKLNYEIFHLYFGTIDQINSETGLREKMSSRKGVVLMEDLLNYAEKKAGENLREPLSNDDVSKIALGAIKFSDFAADRKTGILFDWNKIFSLNGFSGPFIQYAVVRVNKLLNDFTAQETAVEGYGYQTEKKLLLKLAQYPEVVQRAAKDFEPHKLATYLYELARELNRYYDQVRLKESAEIALQARLEVFQTARDVLTDGLDILGIEVPSKM